MKHRWLVLLAFMVVIPRQSLAQFVVSAPATDTLLGTTIVQLGELIAVEADEALNVAATVANLARMLKTANETLATARAVREAYETLKNYSLDDLKRDALAGMIRAMPELGHTIEEIEMLQQQGDLLGDGSLGFWSYKNRHDPKMKKYLEGVATLAIKGTVYPSLFASAGMKATGDAVTESDKLVAYHFAQRGQLLRRAARAGAKGYLSKKIDELVAQAESGKQLDLQIAATGAQAMVGAEGHLELLWAAKHEEIADGVRRQVARQQADNAGRLELSDESADMFKIGVVR